MMVQGPELLVVSVLVSKHGLTLAILHNLQQQELVILLMCGPFFKRLSMMYPRFLNMIYRYNSVTAYMEADVTYFGQLLSCSKQNELHLVTI